MKTFVNPYLKEVPAFNGPGKNLYRAPAPIDLTDYEFIRSLRPNTGTVIIVQNLLWSKLCATLRQHGITDFTKRSDFESFVANCTITDGRTTDTNTSASTYNSGGSFSGRGTPAGGDATENNGGNVRRRASGLRDQPPVAKDVRTNSPRKNRRTA